MRFLLLLTILLSSAALATQEIIAPRVRVLFETPELEPYAQRVASEAERALDVLIPLFGYEPPVITLTIDTYTDVFNAFAPPLPRPRVVLRALFPTEAALAFRAEDDLFLLLVHELTHNLHLAYTETPEGAAVFPRLGLVGETVARMPPMWFLEGLATWAESVSTQGGRLHDALTVGLLESAAVHDAWPTMTEAGLVSFERWPAGHTRYLYGAGFVDYLITQHGFDTVLAVLRHYNAGSYLATFSDAWQAVTGVELQAAWNTWRSELKARALLRAEEAHGGEVLTDTGWYTRAPAVSPDGSHVAWVSWPPRIMVAELGTREERLQDARTLLLDRLPLKLQWLDNDTLIYSRIMRQPGTEFSELFALDVHTGAEAQLTSGARAKLPAVAPEGCILFVHDVVLEGSQLWQWCSAAEDGSLQHVWTAPPAEHIVGLAVSRHGRIAMSLWRGGFVDLALLELDELVYLTQDQAQNLEPVWRDEQTLLFRSDRDAEGVFDLYTLELQDRTLRRLTRTLGGAFHPAAGPDSIWYTELGPEGYNIAELREPLMDEPQSLTLEPLPDPVRAVALHPTRAYSPWASLAPYGWLPTNFNPWPFVLEATVFGQDDSGKHTYAVTAGFDAALAGPLAGAYASVQYGYADDLLLTAFQGASPLSFGVRFGLWPHYPHRHARTETALGLTASVTATLPYDRWTSWIQVQGGPLYLQSYGAWQLDARLDIVHTDQRTDTFGYRTRGLRLGATALWSAAATGPTQGAWVDLSYYQPLTAVSVPGTLELSLRSGYYPSPPIPVALDSAWAGFGTIGYRYSLPVAWRYGDGLHAIERITFEPRFRSWLDSHLRIGGDLTVSFDTVLFYGATASVGGTIGYAEGFWYRFGVRLPL